MDNEMIKDKSGKFVEGFRYSPKTEFKKGEHWRNEKPYWNKSWLIEQYINRQRSAPEIAEDQGCTCENILYFLKKHNIKRRDTSANRKIKHWGLPGESNPMYGKTGEKNHNWKGGISPERQSFYSSSEWGKASKSVRRRDNNKCQICKRKSSKEDRLHIHHIVSFKIKELRSKVDNLMLLCKRCHSWVHSSENKNKKYIKEVLDEG